MRQPAKFEKIALISAVCSDPFVSDVGATNYALREMLKTEAKFGANGILIRDTTPARRTVGMAIYVIRE